MLFGLRHVNISVQVFGNVKHPKNSATWQLRLQFQLLFPTGKH